MGFFNFLTSDIAIDLGTANTLIIYKDKIVVDEPSIIAIDKNNNKVLAIGKQAMNMHEKTHENIKTIRPLKDGVIADFEAAEMMIKGMIKMTDPRKKSFMPSSHRMVICIPSGITEVEKERYAIQQNMQTPKKFTWFMNQLLRPSVQESKLTSL